MTPDRARKRRNPRLIETIEDAEQTALQAVRKFVSAIDDAFPHLSEDKPRRKAIDSTFDMIEQLVKNATGLAKHLVIVTGAEEGESGRTSAAPRKKATASAKATKAAKKTAKKTTNRST